MTRPLVAFVLVALVALGAPRLTSAQSEARCAAELDQAAQHFTEGLFDDALEVIEACLAKDPRRDEKVRVLILETNVLLVLDEKDKAREVVEELLILRSSYEPEPARDSQRFIRLVEEVRSATTTVTVSSVSKTPESLREAPATVVVVTAEEIRRRGYKDLEEVLHDLPGFDISRTNGLYYSNVYQRGLRSDLTNRTPLLVDGVAEDELFTTAVFLSRQFPLINVERVEVIYGPASTMYGANAFAGVINVITREPEAVLGESKNFAFEFDATSGSFGTSYVDAILSGRSPDNTFKWALTARVYRSDEPDLSDLDEFDFDLSFYDSFNYEALPGLNFEGTEEEVARALASDFFEVTEGNFISLSPAGKLRAAELDKRIFSDGFNGRTVGFENPTSDFLIHGKIKLPNLVAGFQTWRREEGWSSWRTDQVGFGDLVYIPRQTWAYVRYNRGFGPNLDIEYFGRYKEQEIDGGSRLTQVRNYARGSLGFDFDALIEGKSPRWEDLFFYASSSQFVHEIKAVYSSSPRFTLVSGVEVKSSSIPGNFVLSSIANPSETGSPISGFGGDNKFRVRDLSFYTQASFWARDDLKIVAGGRIDDNQIRDTGGYGTVFNPRFAVVYAPGSRQRPDRDEETDGKGFGDVVLKAVYSEAFRDEANFNKFNQSADGRFLANPNLAPEEVRNVELSADWKLSESFSLDVTGYESTYSGVVGLAPIEDCSIFGQIDDPDDPRSKCQDGVSQRFDGIGALEIKGVQANARLELGDDFDITANYTFTDPVNTDEEKRIGDIADQQFNVLLNARFLEKTPRPLNLNLRGNFVDDRPTGLAATDVNNNIEGGQIDGFFVVHATVGYENILPGFNLQLIVNNLFDEEYFDPGIRVSDNVLRPNQFRQPERSVFLRISKSLE